LPAPRAAGDDEAIVSGSPPDEGPSLFVQSLPGSFADLGPLGRELRLEPGALLWKEGDPGDHVILLVEGRLEVSHQTPDGEEITIRHLYPGAVAGEMAALDGQARSATVRARSEARVLMIPAGRFREFLRSRPDLLEQLFWLQVERVRSLTWRVSRTHHKAITDPLTGLYNYGFFRERLALELERAHLTGDPLALAMFDIDHFKSYNDSHGHQEGNRVLQKVAELLRETGRRGDVVARYGGEEFVALLYGATAADAWRFAETFRSAVAGQGFAGEASQPLGRISVSGGIATFPLDAQDDIALVKVADRRLYRAKDRGRDSTVGPENEP
jgi:diguanylate cyclase (GGDEF)-like protein